MSYRIGAARLCHWLVPFVVQHLHWTDYKQSVPATLLARVLLFATCWCTSLAFVCNHSRRSPCRESLRRALKTQLPRGRTRLTENLNAALQRLVPRWLHHGCWPLAIDLHQRPAYSKRRRVRNRRLCPGKRKAGTKRFWTFATGAVLWRGNRYNLGLLYMPPQMRLTTVVNRLLQQALQLGITPSYLLLDGGFYAAEVFEQLQKRGIAFITPMPRRGRKPDGGTRRFFQKSTPSGWDDYTWETPRRRRDCHSGRRRKRGQVQMQVRVAVQWKQNNPKKPLVLACWGLPEEWSVRRVVRTYRRRFGIEASYRQVGQCLALTSSQDERVRLLLVGLSLLLQNVWMHLNGEVLSRRRGPSSGQRRKRLPLPLLVLWLLLVLARHLRLRLEMPAEHPLPKEFRVPNTP